MNKEAMWGVMDVLDEAFWADGVLQPAPKGWSQSMLQRVLAIVEATDGFDAKKMLSRSVITSMKNLVTQFEREAT